ncbi:HTH domain-containing protein [Halosimplex aquaticum]|uniref:HTH domain-containing protein n=1 Tax=Halosimplex aquaticum TaxID=3026162 RepID=A0ABD5XVM6_9EURY|nr:HTH domain-containing protein [Halosimplex aquaticum]
MTGTQTPRIELYVRSLLPDGAHERQEAVIERLQELDAEDEIEDFSVIVWGKQIARDSAGARTEEGEYILNRVAEFKQWALSNNVSLESFYQRQTVENDVTDEPYTAMVLPVMGLAEYDGEELRHVAPCTEGEEVHTIMDRLDRLERGEPTAIEQSSDVSILSD